MELFNSVLYFVIVIAILVIFHEFGHFLAARLSKIRVDIFSIGMGPRLFGFNKVLGFTFGSLPKNFDLNGFCDYRVCLFPIGGYVKIAGMIDESMDKSFVNSPPQDYEFRSKGTLTKLFVISAGVLMNVLLAILIFSFISYHQGKVVWETTKIGYVHPNSLAANIGFKQGDVIVSIDGKKVTNWNDIIFNLSLNKFGKTKEITLLRNGEAVIIEVEGERIVRNVAEGKLSLGLTPEKFVVFVRDVEPTTPAGKLGLRPNDTLLAINNETLDAFDELTYLLNQFKNSPILLTWKRGNQVFSDSVVPTKDGKLGFYPGFHFYGKIDTIYYSIPEALINGVAETYKSAMLFVNSVAQIFRGTISFKESVGGPIMIAKSASQQAQMGLISFLNFIALLSITLAIINILPLPALDGGHFIVILIEGIIRKELPIKAKIAIQNIGITLLILLMLFVIYNDIVRLIR